MAKIEREVIAATIAMCRAQRAHRGVDYGATTQEERLALLVVAQAAGERWQTAVDALMACEDAKGG